MLEPAGEVSPTAWSASHGVAAAPAAPGWPAYPDEARERAVTPMLVQPLVEGVCCPQAPAGAAWGQHQGRWQPGWRPSRLQGPLWAAGLRRHGQAGRKGGRGGAAALLIPASRKDCAGQRRCQLHLAGSRLPSAPVSACTAGGGARGPSEDVGRAVARSWWRAAQLPVPAGTSHATAAQGAER